MTPSDPYQKSFATVEELLSNPRGRVRQNPSKAYETIVAAVKASDGYILPRGSGLFAYEVHSGPMTGTYILGKKSNRYVPGFGSTVRHKPTDLRAKIVKVLKPLYNVIHATGLAVDARTPRPRMSTKQIRAELLYQIARPPEGMDKVDLAEARAKMADFSADPKGFTKRLHDEEVLQDMVTSRSFEMAEKLYVLSQAGGVSVKTVIDQVKEKPKRLLGLDNMRIPTRLTDRTRYAAEFLRTWSAGKAADRIVPNVEGGMPTNITAYRGWAPEDIRNLLNKVPSWRQMAVKQESGPEILRARQELFARAVFGALAGDDVLPAPIPLSDKQIKERDRKRADERTTSWVNSMLEIMQDFQSEGISAKVFREQLVRKYEPPQLIRLRDAFTGVREGAAILVQTPEGRLLVRAREEKDWPRLLQGHDQAVAAAGQMRDTSSEKNLALAEAFKRGAEQFTMIPGVRPLITKAEYKCEGDEMHHCVHSMGYYLKRDGYEFAFAAPDGTRATLELDAKTGRVRQLFGPGDSTPSAATRKMADAFLAVNKNNIALLKEGKFPEKSRDNPQRGWT